MKVAMQILVTLVTLLAIAGFLAYRNAARIAEWAAGRRLPNATVRIGELHFSPHSITARNIVTAEKGGAEILRLEGLRIRFSIGGLLKNHVEEIVIDKPVLLVAQDLQKRWNVQRLLPQAPKTPAGNSRCALSTFTMSAGKVTVLGGEIHVGSNQWARLAGPVKWNAEISDLRWPDWQSAKINGRLDLPRCDVDAPREFGGAPIPEIAVRGLEGVIGLRNRAVTAVVTSAPPLQIELVRVGELSVRNVATSVQIESDGTAFYIEFGGPQIAGRVGTKGAGVVVWRDGAVEMQGRTLIGWESLAAVFDVSALRLSNRLEQVTCDGARLTLWQDSAGEWNLQRLLQTFAAPTADGKTTAAKRNERGMQIGELTVRGAQLVLGPNKTFEGLSAVAVDVAASGVDTAHPETMNGIGAVRLAQCAVRLPGRPVSVSGLEANLQLRLGKAAGGWFAADGEARAAFVQYKDTRIEALRGQLQATERGLISTNLAGQFDGNPVTGFGALHLNANPIWFNAGLELKQTDMEKLTAVMVPDRFRVDGTSYLYLEAVGNLQEPVTWAKLQFETKSPGVVYVKDLAKLLAATTLSADKRQLILMAFDDGERLPYKKAWLNADVHQRQLTVSTYFERRAKLFMTMEVAPPPFELPMQLLKEKGWLP
jgi:hypothetical protein